MICSKTAITPATAVKASRSKKTHMKRANRDATVKTIQSDALAGSLPPGNRMSVYLMLPRRDQLNHCIFLPVALDILQRQSADVNKLCSF